MSIFLNQSVHSFKMVTAMSESKKKTPFFLNHTHLHITIFIHKKDKISLFFAILIDTFVALFIPYKRANQNSTDLVAIVLLLPIDLCCFNGVNACVRLLTVTEKYLLGRCCGHVTASIHKVPGCPFTASCTVACVYAPPAGLHKESSA